MQNDMCILFPTTKSILHVHIHKSSNEINPNHKYFVMFVKFEGY